MTYRPARRATIPTADRDRLMTWIPLVIRSAIPAEDRKFCASILKQARRPTWHPSHGQAQWMGRLVDAFQRETLGDDAPVTDQAVEIGA